MTNNRLGQQLSSSITTSNSSNPPQNSTNTHQVSSQQQSVMATLSLRRSASVEYTKPPRKSLLIIS
jgi:hypothetical protein